MGKVGERIRHANQVLRVVRLCRFVRLTSVLANRQEHVWLSYLPIAVRSVMSSRVPADPRCFARNKPGYICTAAEQLPDVDSERTVAADFRPLLELRCAHLYSYDSTLGHITVEPVSSICSSSLETRMWQSSMRAASSLEAALSTARCKQDKARGSSVGPSNNAEHPSPHILHRLHPHALQLA